ncbi:uncharacterized protein [Drosophila kikkawai]|uniref:MSP domain-containing protein n=1 Tax=Drosophila kikkawai TaxID=30033 RepID=A0A6P4JU33_DROKI|nr:uncharacterized protein LOC108086207 [Drosophila kikkawai]
MSGDQLIVSPLSLSFQAPIAHFQKRMITMINASGEDVIYRIQIDKDTVYSVTPMRGRVKSYDTTEVTVTLKPVKEDIPECSLVVRSIPLAMIAHTEEVDWNSTDVLIKLDPGKILQFEEEPITVHLQTDDLAKKKSKCQKKLLTPKAWLKGFLYILGMLAVIMAAYFGFNLKSGRIF